MCLDQEDVFLGPLDAEALYPSLEMKACSQICAKLVAESGLQFEGIDWEWACIFVALSMEEDEFVRRSLNDVIPRRRSRKGPNKPTLRTVEADDRKGRWIFNKDVLKYTPDDKKRVVEALVR